MLSSLFGWLRRLISALQSTPKRSDGLESDSSLPEPLPESSSSPGSRVMTIAWGAKVSQTFRNRIVWTADALGVPVDYLMAVIAFESAETFSPSIRNAAGSGATGLIQFMPATARGLGTTTESLSLMTAEDQINYVYRYLLPYKGRMHTLADVYMAVLWPAAVGKPDESPLWSRASHPTTYRQNAGLDVDGDGIILKREAAAKVQEKLERGRLFAWTGEVTPT